MGLPKISVITPSFNQGEFIEETIFSVISQRYPNLEYILMDGGSTDNTMEIVRRYERHFAVVVSEKDKGQADAMNKGIARATGDIIAILNSDDTYLPGALEFVGAQFERNANLRWMTAPSLYFGPDKAMARIEVMRPDVPDWVGGWLVRQTVPHPSTFVHRELHDTHGGFDADRYFGMDYELWCRFAFGGARLVPFDRPLSSYRMHGLSKSVSAKARMMQDKEEIFNRYVGRLSAGDQRKVRALRKQQAASDGLCPILDDLRAGRRQTAWEKWQQAVREHPEFKFTKSYFTTLARIKLNLP